MNDIMKFQRFSTTLWYIYIYIYFEIVILNNMIVKWLFFLCIIRPWEMCIKDYLDSSINILTNIFSLSEQCKWGKREALKIQYIIIISNTRGV